MDDVLDIRAVSGDVDPANMALLRPAMEQAVARRAVQRDSLDVGGTDDADGALDLSSLQRVLLHP